MLFTKQKPTRYCILKWNSLVDTIRFFLIFNLGIGYYQFLILYTVFNISLLHRMSTLKKKGKKRNEKWSSLAKNSELFLSTEIFSKRRKIYAIWRETKIWNASRICVSSLRRGHANLLCIVPILVYVIMQSIDSLLFESLTWIFYYMYILTE